MSDQLGLDLSVEGSNFFKMHVTNKRNKIIDQIEQDLIIKIENMFQDNVVNKEKIFVDSIMNS